MQTISAKKFSQVIERLLRNYGSNGVPCSHRHLASIIDPDHPPNNAIGQWLRQERLPYGKYMSRIAELLNMSLPEFEIYLADEGLGDPFHYSEADLKQCEELLRRIAMGVKVDQSQVEDVTEIIKNLSVPRLSALHESAAESLETLILKKQDPTMLLIYRMQNAILAEVIKKLSVLAKCEQLSS